MGGEKERKAPRSASARGGRRENRGNREERLAGLARALLSAQFPPPQRSRPAFCARRDAAERSPRCSVPSPSHAEDGAVSPRTRSGAEHDADERRGGEDEEQRAADVADHLTRARPRRRAHAGARDGKSARERARARDGRRPSRGENERATDAARRGDDARMAGIGDGRQTMADDGRWIQNAVHGCMQQGQQGQQGHSSVATSADDGLHTHIRFIS